MAFKSIFIDQEIHKSLVEIKNKMQWKSLNVTTGELVKIFWEARK